MDLRLSEEQQFIKAGAREFLENECPMSAVRKAIELPQGYSPELWHMMSEMGLMGAAIPESYGGMGGSVLDLCLLLEETGRFQVPGPYFSTVALGGLAITTFGSEGLKAEFLPQIAGGTHTLSYAVAENGAFVEPGSVPPLESDGVTATPCGNAYRLDGQASFVPYAREVDTLLTVARTGDAAGDLSLFLADASKGGLCAEPLDTLGFDRLCRVTFRSVEIGGNRVLGAIGDGLPIAQAIHAWGAVGKCAEMLGGMQRVLDMSVDYAKTRVQFGRPIGSFQAVQHHCANMAVDVAASRHITYEAAWRLSEALDAAEQVAVAKGWVSAAYGRVCALAHQVFGAIGFTWEHDMHLYFRHATAAGNAFGDEVYHRERLAGKLGI